MRTFPCGTARTGPRCCESCRLQWRRESTWALSAEPEPAGKSSVIAALFRLTPFVEGRIALSGRDGAGMTLAQLRSQMTLISQVPFLFRGTLRANLDPFGAHSDAQIATALSAARVALPPDFAVAERGHNISQGQRQPVWLARALLRDTPILRRWTRRRTG